MTSGFLYYRVINFCDLETKTEFRLVTNLPASGEAAVSDDEIRDIYRIVLKDLQIRSRKLGDLQKANNLEVLQHQEGIVNQKEVIHPAVVKLIIMDSIRRTGLIDSESYSLHEFSHFRKIIPSQDFGSIIKMHYT